jgi:hypothetical protein
MQVAIATANRGRGQWAKSVGVARRSRTNQSLAPLVSTDLASALAKGTLDVALLAGKPNGPLNRSNCGAPVSIDRVSRFQLLALFDIRRTQRHVRNWVKQRNWLEYARYDVNVESRGGISPPRAPRTVREPLDSHGSRCSAVAVT